MEELLELRICLEQQRYADALSLVAEMEEMSRDDKISKIENFAEIVLLHLIKRATEKRTARSWDLSIRNGVRHIRKTNTRRKSGGTYLDTEEIQAILRESYQPALERAALETFEGRYDAEELGQFFDPEAVQQEALRFIQEQEETPKHTQHRA